METALLVPCRAEGKATGLGEVLPLSSDSHGLQLGRVLLHLVG